MLTGGFVLYTLSTYYIFINKYILYKSYYNINVFWVKKSCLPKPFSVTSQACSRHKFLSLEHY